MKRTEILDILFSAHTHSVRDVLWGNVPFTKPMKSILEVKAFEKLSRIKQNGPTYHIYPGAVHTRASHSIGVYALSREILIALSRKNDELPFTREGIWSFLIASLLHDIGHFPYAHSLKDIAVKEHEEIAYEIINSDDELKNAIENVGGNAMKTALIIASKRQTDDTEVSIYRKILSGTLDPDKLDYLSRDAYFAGVPYGIQNTDYIISSLDLRGTTLVLEEEASLSLEHILFSKYMMYKSIYWHKGTRAATSMIKKAICHAIADGIISIEDLYKKDDEEFLSLAKEHSSYPPFHLIIDAEHGKMLERKASIPLDKLPFLSSECQDLTKRLSIERILWEFLKKKGETLDEFDVVIDIPEPIRFENDMLLLRKDGKIEKANESESIFSGETGKSFSRALRKFSVYAPSGTSEENILSAVAFLEEDLWKRKTTGR